MRGEFAPPKSERSSRSVPLADRLAGELDRLHRKTAYRTDDDLVFAHPRTGKPIDRSRPDQLLGSWPEKARVSRQVPLSCCGRTHAR